MQDGYVFKWGRTGVEGVVNVGVSIERPIGQQDRVRIVAASTPPLPDWTSTG
jgi:hypothetical protein